MRIMLFGAPGVGKGSQAVHLAKMLQVPHISTGDIFRYNIANKTELGIEASNYIEKGALVPDELTVQIVADRLNQEDCNKGFILDGFPRTIQQAEYFDKIMKELDIKLDIIINIVLDDESIIKRLSGRRICPECNAVYHIEDKPPQNEEVCDSCNTKLIQRADDREETIKNRLHIYHQQTAPILDYYKDKVRIEVLESRELLSDTTEEMLKILGI